MKFEREAWSKWVKATMKNRGISYQLLADWLKVSKAHVWRLLNKNSVAISVDEFLLISRHLKLNPVEFLVDAEVQLKLI